MSYPIIEPVEQVGRPANALRMRPRSSGAYIQHCNLVYAQTAGVGLVMDVFQPANAPNGLAIVDVVSGAWHADRARLNEHIGLGAIDAFCEAGFTIFAVAPGSATLFSALQMVDHINAAIRYVRVHGEDWGVCPRPMGLFGVSAGGHLAALAASSPETAVADARQAWFRQDTGVDALGLFFPPTDLIDYGGQPFNFDRTGDLAVPRLLFAEGKAGHSAAEIEAGIRRISPRHQVKNTYPPVFLAHATGDAVVPYSQSVQFAETLGEAGIDVRFVTHEGPGHPWRTIGQECVELTNWFAMRLQE